MPTQLTSTRIHAASAARPSGSRARVAAYAILLLPAAERDWRKLPSHIQTRIGDVLLRLEQEPRLRGAATLAAIPDRWRLRAGDYRIMLRIHDAAREILILRIAHRRQTYR